MGGCNHVLGSGGGGGGGGNLKSRSLEMQFTTFFASKRMMFMIFTDHRILAGYTDGGKLSVTSFYRNPWESGGRIRNLSIIHFTNSLQYLHVVQNLLLTVLYL